VTILEPLCFIAGAISAGYSGFRDLVFLMYAVLGTFVNLLLLESSGYHLLKRCACAFALSLIWVEYTLLLVLAIFSLTPYITHGPF
jgi:hypothetical protein